MFVALTAVTGIIVCSLGLLCAHEDDLEFGCSCGWKNFSCNWKFCGACGKERQIKKPPPTF